MEVCSSDEDWSDVEEDQEQNHSQVLCLFCKEIFSEATKCLGHIKDVHGFDVIRFCKTNDVDFYGFIMLINYIRANSIDEKAVKSLENSVFIDDAYLKPVLIDDGLLQADFDGLMEEGNARSNGEASAIIQDEEKTRLEDQLKEAEKRALIAEENLTRAVGDLQKCKQEMQKLLLNSNSKKEEDPGSGFTTEESRAYFESYAHHSIHEEMLKDRIRTESYRDFILSNPGIFKGKVVLDVGCGTGILSMFAARAGAKFVIAVDQSDIAYQAMDIIRENGLHEQIKVIKGDAEKLILPDGMKKVDVIISEWMGYFLLFESMLDSVLRCRDKFLDKTGSVYPDCCSMYIAGISDEDTWNEKIGFWDDIYGHRMSCMKKYAIEEPLIDIVKEKALITGPAKIAIFDMASVNVKDLEFEADFCLNVEKAGNCTGLVGYFDVQFDKNATTPVSFSTGCHVQPTHWKQTVFIFEKKVQVTQGEVLKGKVNCRKDLKDKRALFINYQIAREDGDVLIEKSYSLC